MGNQKLKWTSEEEDALKAGIAKHGTGKWKNILKDPDFAHSLIHRSNIDLKDKWRNMSISTSLQGGGGSKEKVKICRSKTLALYPLPNTQNSAGASGPDEDMADDPPNNMLETTKNVPAAPGHHQLLVFEALAAMNDPNGSDIGTIIKYIEQRHPTPQNFRRLLSSKLRRLVMSGKLEKVQNNYKIGSIETATATATVPAPALLLAPAPAQAPIHATPIKMVPPRQKDVRAARLMQNMSAEETMEEAALSAAYMIVESENKSFVAAEAVREAERVAKLNEDSESLLQLVKEIYERCSRGERVRVAG